MSCLPDSDETPMPSIRSDASQVWTIEELALFQRTSRAIGIPLSRVLLFAEQNRASTTATESTREPPIQNISEADNEHLQYQPDLSPYAIFSNPLEGDPEPSWTDGIDPNPPINEEIVAAAAAPRTLEAFPLYFSDLDASMPDQSSLINGSEWISRGPFEPNLRDAMPGAFTEAPRIQELDDEEESYIAASIPTMDVLEALTPLALVSGDFLTGHEETEVRQDVVLPVVKKTKRRRQQMSGSNASAPKDRSQKRVKPGRSVIKCLKCAIEQKRCVPTPDGPCERCAGFKSYTPNCVSIYTKLVEIDLFRVATPDFLLVAPLGLNQEILNRVQVQDIREPTTISLTQDLGAVLTLDIQRFDPSNIDLAELPENQRSLYRVPFALKSIEESTKAMRSFVPKCAQPYLQAKLRDSDEISKSIFRLIIGIIHSKTSDAGPLSRVLYLWTAARMMEGGWRFCGAETLGLPRDSNGIIEIVEAPFIDYQFAGILRDSILLPTRNQVLQDLQRSIYDKHYKSKWLYTFLANYVLLNTYEHLIQQQHDVAREWGLTTRYPSLKLICGIHHGAKILLTHFHDGIKGQKVFEKLIKSPEATKKELEDIGLERPHIQVLERLAPMVDAKVSAWVNLVSTDEYGKEHWFTGQLFHGDWREPSTIEHMPLA